MSRAYRYGFIGCGNMGSAMLGGILNSKIARKGEIIASCHSKETKHRIEQDYGIAVTVDNTEVVENSDMIIFAVKPYQLDIILPQLHGHFKKDQVIVSVAAGKAMDTIEQSLISIEVAGHLKVARAMPNTPALVGEAMSAVSFNDKMTETDQEAVVAVFQSFGKAEVVPETLMDVVTGVSGSSPAFIYMIIEAMADAAVSEGMPRSQAYTFAAQSVLGSAKMVLTTGKHPGELKDAVCSPNGTTIAGVMALEEDGLRATVMNGICAAVDRSREM